MTMFAQFVGAFLVARVIDEHLLRPLGRIAWEKLVLWAWAVSRGRVGRVGG
jgi:hypothetical protein